MQLWSIKTLLIAEKTYRLQQNQISCNSGVVMLYAWARTRNGDLRTFYLDKSLQILRDSAIRTINNSGILTQLTDYIIEHLLCRRCWYLPMLIWYWIVGPIPASNHTGFGFTKASCTKETDSNCIETVQQQQQQQQQHCIFC